MTTCIIMPETCWAASKWLSNKFYNWLLHLVVCFIWMMYVIIYLHDGRWLNHTRNMDTKHSLCTKGSLGQCLTTRVPSEIMGKKINNLKLCKKIMKTLWNITEIFVQQMALLQKETSQSVTLKVNLILNGCELTFWCLYKLPFNLILCICVCMWVEIT
jgi:hypothetical protein